MIDFSNVENIIIPEGEVTLITRGDEVLWQKYRLPLAYQEVAWLESTGTQYIDTNYIAANSPSFKGRWKRTTTKYSIFGAKSGASNTNIHLVSTGSVWGTHDQVTMYYSQYYMGVFYVPMKSWHEYDVGKGYAQIDTERKTTTQNFVASGKPIILFGQNNNGTLTLGSLRHGYFQIYKDDQLIRDFVPCVRKRDGVAGMYDLCGTICPLTNSPFYTNAGTGEFLYGEEEEAETTAVETMEYAMAIDYSDLEAST